MCPPNCEAALCQALRWPAAWKARVVLLSVGPGLNCTPATHKQPVTAPGANLNFYFLALEQCANGTYCWHFASSRRIESTKLPRSEFTAQSKVDSENEQFNEGTDWNVCLHSPSNQHEKPCACCDEELQFDMARRGEALDFQRDVSPKFRGENMKIK